MRKFKEKLETFMILFNILLAILIAISFIVFLSDMNQNISILPLIYLLVLLFYILNFFNNISDRNKYSSYRKTNPKDDNIFLHMIFIGVSLIFLIISLKLLWL